MKNVSKPINNPIGATSARKSLKRPNKNHHKTFKTNYRPSGTEHENFSTPIPLISSGSVFRKQLRHIYISNSSQSARNRIINWSLPIPNAKTTPFRDGPLAILGQIIHRNLPQLFSKTLVYNKQLTHTTTVRFFSQPFVRIMSLRNLFRRVTAETREWFSAKRNGFGRSDRGALVAGERRLNLRSRSAGMLAVRPIRPHHPRRTDGPIVRFRQLLNNPRTAEGMQTFFGPIANTDDTVE